MGKETDLIIKLRADTAQLRKDLKKSKSMMRGFNKNISKIGTDIRNQMLAAFGGAAIIQGIRMAVGSLADFEFAMDKVAAITDASGDALEALKNNALELGRTTKFTATEIAGLQLELSKLGFSSDKIIASTDAIRKLATVADEDLGESAKTLAGTLNSFNLEATESERVANTMAESFSKSALTLEKFTVATANSGAIANALGVTLESNTARIGALVDANIDASKAGTDLRKIYIDLNKAGIDYDTALDMVANSSDKVGKATELVGIRAAGALVILSQQRRKVDELTKSLGDNNMELDGMVDVMEDNLLTDWKKFTSAVDGLVQKMQTGLPVVREFTQLMTDSVNAISENLAGKDAAATKLVDDLTSKIPDLNKRAEVLNRTIAAQKERFREVAASMARMSSKTATSSDQIILNNKSLKRLQNTYDINLSLIKALSSARTVNNKALEGESSKVKEVTKDMTAYWAAVSKMQEAGTSIGGLKGFGIESVQLESGVTDPFGRLPKHIDEATKKVEASMSKFNSTYEMKSNEFIDISNSIKMTMAAAAVGVFDSIGNAIGGGGETFNDGVNKFLSIIGEGMKSIGAAMVTFATLKIAFDQAIFTNPYVALAVGGALVVAGAALSAAAKNADSNVSSSGGGTTRGGGGFAFDRSGQSVDVNGEFKISGQDLVLVLNQQNRSDSRNVG